MAVASFDSYAETLPTNLKALFRDSLAMDKLLKTFDHCFYCLEEVY